MYELTASRLSLGITGFSLVVFLIFGAFAGYSISQVQQDLHSLQQTLDETQKKLGEHIDTLELQSERAQSLIDKLLQKPEKFERIEVPRKTGPNLTVTGPRNLNSDLILNSHIRFTTGGFIIRSGNITLDLNGFTITGPYLQCTQCPRDSSGVAIIGSSGVTIKNGVIEGFVSGIRISNSFGNVIEDLVIRGSTFNGVSLPSNAGGNIVRRVTVTENGFFGIEINAGSHRNLVTDSRFSENVLHGLIMGGVLGPARPTTPSTGNRIESNLFVNNGGHGLLIFNGHDNIITKNIVDNNGQGGGAGHGIALAWGSRGNIIQGNMITNNLRQGIDVSPVGGPPGRTEAGIDPEDNQITDNELSGNNQDILDRTSGSASKGTKNTYKNNRCTSSIPPAICDR